MTIDAESTSALRDRCRAGRGQLGDARLSEIGALVLAPLRALQSAAAP